MLPDEAQPPGEKRSRRSMPSVSKPGNREAREFGRGRALSSRGHLRRCHAHSDGRHQTVRACGRPYVVGMYRPRRLLEVASPEAGSMGIRLLRRRDLLKSVKRTLFGCCINSRDAPPGSSQHSWRIRVRGSPPFSSSTPRGWSRGCCWRAMGRAAARCPDRFISHINKGRC